MIRGHMLSYFCAHFALAIMQRLKEKRRLIIMSKIKEQLYLEFGPHADDFMFGIPYIDGDLIHFYVKFLESKFGLYRGVAVSSDYNTDKGIQTQVFTSEMGNYDAHEFEFEFLLPNGNKIKIEVYMDDLHYTLAVSY